MWDFFGYAKNKGIFLGRQILKLGFFGYNKKTYEPLMSPPSINISKWGP